MLSGDLRSSRLGELAEEIRQYRRDEGGSQEFGTAIEGLTILRSDREVHTFHRIASPALWIIVQGEKLATVGEKQFDYRDGEALLITVEEPCRCVIRKATQAKPFLGLVIEIGRTAAQEVIEELTVIPTPSRERKKLNAFVLPLDASLLDCALRAVRLLKRPSAIPALYPGIMREICYWLLSGQFSRSALQIIMANNHDERIVQALRYLRASFKKEVRVDQLSATTGMSTATFHRRFKEVTSMSPLQYQKQLRLIEARRLLLAGNTHVESIAVEVGYASASQFSREYARLFGKPPSSEITAQKLLRTNRSA